MRGTDDLLPEQRPNPFARNRKRKGKGRAQPYRRHGRELGPSLTAMLKGSPTYLPNPMDLTRLAQKRRKRPI